MNRPVVHNTACAYQPTPCILSATRDARRILCGSSKNMAPIHTATARMCIQIATRYKTAIVVVRPSRGLFPAHRSRSAISPGGVRRDGGQGPSVHVVDRSEAQQAKHRGGDVGQTPVTLVRSRDSTSPG